MGLVFFFFFREGGESLKAPTTVLINDYTQIYTPSILILYVTLKWYFFKPKKKTLKLYDYCRDAFATKATILEPAQNFP